jgi:hypothetical protein
MSDVYLKFILKMKARRIYAFNIAEDKNLGAHKYKRRQKNSFIWNISKNNSLLHIPGNLNVFVI